MEIETLQILCQVAERRSFASVARLRGVDPSSISRTVANAEAELGLRLFQRSTRHVQPTEAGALYLERVAPLIVAIEAARAHAAGHAARPSGTVRITASVAFGHEVLVPLLPALRSDLPEISLELMLDDGTVDLVAQGVDIALRLAPAPKGDLISVRLRKTRYAVVASPDCARSIGVDPRALSDQDVLRMTLQAHRTEWLFRRLPGGEPFAVSVSGHILISNPLALREAARNGLGPALLADWLVAGDLASGRLVRLFDGYDVTATTFDTSAWLLYPSRSHLPLKVRAVIDALRRAI